VSAEDIAREYLDDKDATHKKFKDRVLEVRGEVLKIEKNEVGAASVFLKGIDEVVVNCRFAATEAQQADALKVGSSARIVGQYINLLEENEVSLVFCLRISDSSAGP
jgi:hypothetical protein